MTLESAARYLVTLLVDNKNLPTVATYKRIKSFSCLRLYIALFIHTVFADLSQSTLPEGILSTL